VKAETVKREYFRLEGEASPPPQHKRMNTLGWSELKFEDLSAIQRRKIFAFILLAFTSPENRNLKNCTAVIICLQKYCC
jgi:hypothetical protein